MCAIFYNYQFKVYLAVNKTLLGWANKIEKVIRYIESKSITSSRHPGKKRKKRKVKTGLDDTYYKTKGKMVKESHFKV